VFGVQLQDIQQIEIVRGPNSALFGFNAVSGVVNIITVNPLHTQEANLTAEAGTHGYGQVSANAAFKLGERFGLHLSGGYSGLDELKGLASSPLGSNFGIPKPRRGGGTIELYGRLGEKTEATLSATHGWDRQTEVVNVPLTTPVHGQFTALGARISHDTGWGILGARIYKNDSDIRAPLAYGPDGKLVRLQFNNNVTVMSADAVVRVGDSNTARLSVERRHNMLWNSPGYDGATHYDVASVGGMWESAPADWLTLTLAGRFDHLKLEQRGVVDQPTLFTAADFDRSIDTWSLNSAALFKLDRASTLRVAAGRGVQAPSLFSLGSRLTIPIPGPFPYVSSGNPHLDPSIIWSGEVGYSRVLENLGGRLELTAFYNRTQDVVGSPDSATPALLTPPRYPFILIAAQNVGSVEAYGLEASLSGRLGAHLLWSANYTWTRASQKIAGEVGDTFHWPVAFDRSTPEHKLKGQVTYEQGRWLATAAARYTSKSQQLVRLRGALAPYDISQTVALDAKVAYRLTPKLTLEAAGENLTGADGVDLSPVAAERRLRAGVKVQF
jgi:iron complex outermembrane receptor protein